MRNIYQKIIYLVGVAVTIAALFIPAKTDSILEDYNIGNLFDAFTAKVQGTDIYVVQLLFGHTEHPIGLSPVILQILVVFLPILLLLAAAVFMFIKKTRVLHLILSIAGAVIIIGTDLLMLMGGSSCIGQYIAFAGVVIALVGTVLYFFSSGSKTSSEDYDDYEDEFAGVITCTGGCLAGSTFEVPDTVIIGKDPAQCNLVLDNKTISRVHCIIRYIVETDTYTIKDVSSNGTFFADGTRLTKGYEMQVKRETEIYMGSPRESFYLD